MVAEDLGDAGQRGGEVDGAEDEHLRRRRERLDEHGHRPLTRLTVLAVVAHDRDAGRQLATRVACDDSIKIGITERTCHVVVLRRHEQFGAAVRAFDHRGDRHRPVVAQGLGQTFVDHQSSGSMNRWIVPPQ